MNLKKNFIRLQKYCFCKKIEAIAVQLLVQSPGKLLSVIWNIFTETYQNFLT